MSGDAALAELERTLAAGSKTFHLASRFLPNRVRQPTLALYAFCRHADDAVDDAGNAGAARIAVADLRARVDRVFSGRPGEALVERAFTEVVERYRIPRALPDALVEGMEWDAAGRRYEDIAALRAYGVRVAGSVGIMMSLIMGTRDPEVLARACDLGVAMQLTNIARDVGEDARLGRVYLPLGWLEGANVDADEFVKAPQPTRAIRDLTARLLRDAEVQYARSDAGVGHLPGDCRVAIRAARLVYADIARSIREADFDSVTRRAFVPAARKAVLVARALPARFWSAEPLGKKRSPEAASLLDAALAGG